ncbi:hypothetical protein C9J01_27000 [Photobacterium rosenbergii]|uniref:Uncharacterized protein n=1 Tax=Photobacterium rosenbergii TaxID=294936 RepID=A0A2T3N136_9GAMM|nr:hypothetical protein C9J01_27000 [Photobacterium rosenbergii]
MLLAVEAWRDISFVLFQRHCCRREIAGDQVLAVYTLQRDITELPMFWVGMFNRVWVDTKSRVK